MIRINKLVWTGGEIHDIFDMTDRTFYSIAYRPFGKDKKFLDADEVERIIIEWFGDVTNGRKQGVLSDLLKRLK